MTTRFIKAVALIACSVFSTLALADPPARVGRVSLAQGEVTISSDVGAEASAAQVNWPVTSQNRITTGHSARTEIRIGSTSVRLDADSSMEVSELDDDSLRLHLNYGTASVRVRQRRSAARLRADHPERRASACKSRAACASTPSACAAPPPSTCSTASRWSRTAARS